MGSSWRDGVPWAVALAGAFLLGTCSTTPTAPLPRGVPDDLADLETVFVGFRSPVQAVGDEVSELYGRGGVAVTSTSARPDDDRVVVEVRSEGDEGMDVAAGTRCLVYEFDAARQEAHLQDLHEGDCPGI